MMFTINLTKENGTPVPRTAEGVEVPALPRVGDYIEHEPSGIKGCVKHVNFWWDDYNVLAIEVRLSK